MEALKAISKIEERIQDLEMRVLELEKLLRSKPAEAIKKKMSIKEFLLAKNAKDDQQRTLLIGYFLEKYESQASFNIKDLEKGFRDGKIKPPQNINDKVNKNISKGYMMEDAEAKDNKKAWILTSTGELVVSSGFKENL